MDLIDRQAAIDALDKRFDSIPMEQTTEILLLRKDLRNLPSAQPDLSSYSDKLWRAAYERGKAEAQMRGRWIWKGAEGDSRHMCSVCKTKEYVPTCNGVPNIWQFCPNCGARMDGGEQDE